MKSFNVVVTVSTTICVDANTPADAINKVQHALDTNDTGTSIQLGENLSCALRSSLSGFWKRSWTITASRPDALARLAAACSVMRAGTRKR